jgi:hypothetical protein
MQLMRMFSREKYKGTRHYLSSQKKYEVLRTFLYFALSLSLFFAGWLVLGTKTNLLTIVAVLGCLPAGRSAVDMVMFLRSAGCPEAAGEAISSRQGGLTGGYDFIFTSYSRNYRIAHLVIQGNAIYGYAEDRQFPEQDFRRHLDGILKANRFPGISVKIFTELERYLIRLEQLPELRAEETNAAGILALLKNVSL